MTDAVTDAQPSTAAAVPARRSSRRRGVLVGLLGLLACLALVASTSLFWIHQAVLVTDRWVAITTSVAQDPAVVESLSVELSQQIMTALDVRGRLEKNLPDRAALLAGPISGTIQERLQAGIARLLSSDGFQTAWTKMNRVAHATIVKLLRGESDSVALQNGVVSLNLFPLVGTALASLQSDGVIPANVTLPDLSDPTAPERARVALQSALNVTLPDTFGTIALVRADRLQALRTAVHVFDLIVVAALLITALLFIAAAFLARNRLRAILLLAAGAVVALVVARGVIRGVENAMVGAVSDGPGQVTVKGVVDAALKDLFGLMVVVTVLGIVVVILAWLFGRRAQVAEVVSSAGSAVRGAAVSGAAASSSGAADASGAAASSGVAVSTGVAGSRVSLMDRARAHRMALRIAGVVLIVGWLALIADGWEPVVIGGALLLLYQVALDPLLDRSAEVNDLWSRSRRSATSTRSRCASCGSGSRAGAR